MRILLLALSFFLISASPAVLNEARSNFPDAAKSEQRLNRVLSKTEKSTDLIVRAYFGAYTIMSAQYTNYPLRKYNRFVKGKNIIENSIKQKPKSIELRFIRLMIQLETPDFLGYSSQVSNDFNYIISNKSRLKTNAVLYRKVKLNLNQSKKLTEYQKKKLKQL